MNKVKMTIVTMAACLAAVAAPSGLLRSGRPGAAAPTPTAEEATAAADASSLNFNQAPVEMVFEAYSKLVGKTIVRDPAAPTPTITLQTNAKQKLTNEDQIALLELVLEMNGIHLEDYGEKFIRALPRGKVRKEGIPMILDPEAELGDTSRVVSLMLQFKNISAEEEAQKALEGFKSETGILLVFERINSILVTDTEQNVNRMREIARQIDIATPVLEQVFVRQVKFATAEEIKTALEAIVQESQKELEKEGKGAQNAQANQQAMGPRGPMGRGRMLGQNRAGQADAQPQPAANSSLVASISDADRGMIRGKVLILADERSNKLIIVTQKTNMDFFDKVIEQLDVETTPDTLVKVYRLKYADAEEVSDMINDLIGNTASSSSKSQKQNQASKSGSGGNLTSRAGTKTTAAQPTAKMPANQKSGDAKAGELSKENTVVLADKRINGLVVMTQKELVPTIESIIESMDVKLSQVLIETVIIEVGLGDDLKTGVDWVQNGRFTQRRQEQLTDSLGRKLFYAKNGKTGQAMSKVVPEDYSYTWKDSEGNSWTDTISDFKVFGEISELVKDAFMTGSPGYAQMLGGGASGGSAAADVVMGITTNIFGSGINYVFKSDKLNLSAIIQASKTDSHSKYLASPIVMTVDNKEATIEATEMRYLFKGYQYSGSSMYGSAVPDYEQKELGITIKMTPKINPNGTIQLEVETEYSQPGGKQTIAGEGGKTFDAENTVTRKMSADVLLENMQTAILGGLTKTYYSESESGIPILKDIPFIGKWLFGSVSQEETRSELLIFMQPYVLDEGDATQAEALRRKKTLSISRPWEDHGWSLSELADPISKAEQMRRLKEEWKKQDEERKTKLAIEAEKVKRAKALRDMSKEERDFWLEMHKDELEEEQQEELERKMLDEESQGELRDLAARIRERKLRSANTAIREADEAARLENERGRLEAEKRGETPLGDEPELEVPLDAAPAPENEETPEPAAEPAVTDEES